MKKITHKNIRYFILKSLKDFKNIEIVSDEKDNLVIEYGWSDYEEYNNNVVTINYDKFTIKKVDTGYSVYGGDYSFEDTMKFSNEHDLYANFLKGIREYFDTDD